MNLFELFDRGLSPADSSHGFLLARFRPRRLPTAS